MKLMTCLIMCLILCGCGGINSTEMLFLELQGATYGDEKILCVDWKQDGVQFHTFYLLKCVSSRRFAKKKWIHTIEMDKNGWVGRYISNCEID